MAAPTVSAMMTEIYSICRTTPLVVAKVLESMNRCINMAAEEFHLGALKTNATVNTTLSQNYSSLPATFHKTIYLAENVTTKELIATYETSEELWTDFYSELDEAGDVEGVCAELTSLLYQRIPASAQELKIHFYALPTLLTLASDSPTMFPEKLAEPILVNWVVEDFLSKQKVNQAVNKKIQDHHGRFLEAKEALRACSSRPTKKIVKRIKTPPRTYRI